MVHARAIQAFICENLSSFQVMETLVEIFPVEEKLKMWKVYRHRQMDNRWSEKPELTAKVS